MIVSSSVFGFQTPPRPKLLVDVPIYVLVPAETTGLVPYCIIVACVVRTNTPRLDGSCHCLSMASSTLHFYYLALHPFNNGFVARSLDLCASSLESLPHIQVPWQPECPTYSSPRTERRELFLLALCATFKNLINFSTFGY